MLTKDEERDLITAWQSKGDVNARNKLIMAHTGMISRMARQRGRVDMFDDFFQVAVEGAMVAADKFDLSKDTRFSTFLYWRVKVAMNKLSYQNKKFRQEVTTLDVRMMDSDDTAKDMISGDDMPQEDVVFGMQSEHALFRAVQGLKPRYRDVVSMLFYEDMNHREAAEELGVTHQAISYFRDKAITSLRKSMTEFNPALNA